MVGSPWSQLSKAIGWEPRHVVYPTMEDLERAFAARNNYALLNWNRFLPSPDTQERTRVMDRLVECLVVVRRELENE